MNYRLLTTDEIARLEKQNCTAENWANVQVKEGFSPDYMVDAHFSGSIRLGIYNQVYTLPGGLKVHSGIQHAVLHNCQVGDDAHIYNVHNYVANYIIGNNTCIENVNSILVEGRTMFGNGLRVPVMNEGGGREIPIYDHLSAHLAYMLTMYRHRTDMIRLVNAMIDEYAERQASDMGYIGNNVCILNCGSIKNVRIGDCAKIAGTSVLKNGSINSNAQAPVQIGSGVKCNGFIISSGVEISDSTLISKCFVGQGCVFGKHYSALDSLFFANCQGFHGEATAIFAGPYTVTHHKSSLLIAGMFSFMNAGSGSNQSNHMYKLGPIHQGVVDRGSKTTSDSYMLWPAKVGPFTLVMGRHTHHADTSDLPFSYLIENNSDSYIVPGVNLRSVGTIRDAQKWPKRDNRKDPHLLDYINFNLLSPYTIQKMMQGKTILQDMKQVSGETTDVYGFHNCKIRNSSLNHGIKLYETGIRKFLGNSLISRLEHSNATTLSEIRCALAPDSQVGTGLWADVAGLIVPRTELKRLLDDVEQGTINDLEAITSRLKEMYDNYYSYEWTWALHYLEERWGCPYTEVSINQLSETISQWQEAVLDLDWQVYDDAKKEFSLNARTGFGVDGDAYQQSLDFESVRGSFESNSFVLETLAHIDRKTELGRKMQDYLSSIVCE